jgi:MSHA pilin protein MshA
MNKTNLKRKNAQAGFTLIELIVVIVILGILAATALPKFADLGGDARVAKMQAAAGALKSATAMVHAQWLVLGSPAADGTNSTSSNSKIVQEGVNIAFLNGYPDVGGDGSANGASDAPSSGIVRAAGGLTDYNLTATAATSNVLTVRPDADTNRANCKIIYTEATATAAPVVDASGVTAANCD